MKKYFLFTILFLFIFFAQKNFVEAKFESPYSCPNFEFLHNLQKGDTDEEVYVLQQILNLDKRTIVSYVGPGSKGHETALFGNATREALKRFQALFIEYIEVADGKFNTKTKTVMNNVCKGPFFTGLGKNPYDMGTTTDKLAPIVGVAGPIQAEINTPFRAYLAASEAIKTPTLAGLIIEGATAGDIRKTSSTTFSFLITPNQDNKGEIKLQFEADAIEDLAGNKNEEASNEWVIAIVGLGQATSTDSLDTSILDSILNSIPSATSTNCSTVVSLSVTDYANPCYGKVPTTNPNAGEQKPEEKKKDDGIMQMLSGLMQGLMKALGGGGGKGGGDAGGDSRCACTGEPTSFLSPKGGSVSPGAYKTTANPRSGSSWTGSVTPPAGICGQKIGKNGCEQPQLNEMGQPYMGNVGPKGAFDWSSKN